MECLFSAEMTEQSPQVILSGDESKHAKALRLRINDPVLITNGKGLAAECVMTGFDKAASYFNIVKFRQNYGEPSKKVTAAVGIMDVKDRFEFAVEKAVELGVVRFIPLICEYSSLKKYSVERFTAKAAAAMKQCRRSVLPEITEPAALEDVLNFSDCGQIIAADINGESKIDYENEILLLIGPEGGFSDKEIQMIREKEASFLYLGNRRLRAETALTVSLSKILL